MGYPNLANIPVLHWKGSHGIPSSSLPLTPCLDGTILMEDLCSFTLARGPTHPKSAFPAQMAPTSRLGTPVEGTGAHEITITPHCTIPSQDRPGAGGNGEEHSEISINFFTFLFSLLTRLQKETKTLPKAKRLHVRAAKLLTPLCSLLRQRFLLNFGGPYTPETWA